MCEAGRGLHGLLAVFSSAALQRHPKRHSTQKKPDREPRELAPLLPAPTVLCITEVIFHITDIVHSGEQKRTLAGRSLLYFY